MAVDRRQKDVNWYVADENGKMMSDCTYSSGFATLATLMDIRDELKLVRQQLQILQCPNFVAIPRVLKQIRANTAKPRKLAARRKRSKLLEVRS